MCTGPIVYVKVVGDTSCTVHVSVVGDPIMFYYIHVSLLCRWYSLLGGTVLPYIYLSVLSTWNRSYSTF